MLKRAGHEVTGLDCEFYRGCDFPGYPKNDVPMTVSSSHNAYI